MREVESILATEDGIVRAFTALARGGVIAHATETCYGFACDLCSSSAVARLFAIKQRPTDQPVSVLFSSVEDAKRYVTWNARADELAHAYLPGPLTIILPVRLDPSFSLHTTPNRGGRGGKGEGSLRSIGVRVSSHPLATTLVTRFGRPIATTSANLHGKPPCYSAEEIRAQFSNQKEQPDLILNSGPLETTPPSRVLDLTGFAPHWLR